MVDLPCYQSKLGELKEKSMHSLYARSILSLGNHRDILQSKEDASPHEDYGHKAMEYFRERIEQYGECTAVPIRSLLGEKLLRDKTNCG